MGTTVVQIGIKLSVIQSVTWAMHYPSYSFINWIAKLVELCKLTCVAYYDGCSNGGCSLTY